MKLAHLIFSVTMISGAVSAQDAPMSLDAYKDLAEHANCFTGTRDYVDGLEELFFAYAHGLITDAAYDWGLETKFYPVIDRNNVIQSVCQFEVAEMLIPMT